MTVDTASEVFTGRFGTYQITVADRRGVLTYRLALLAMAISFTLAGIAVIAGGSPWLVSALFALFAAALAVALFTIHIYMLALHRALWALWAVGVAASVALSFALGAPIAQLVAANPLTVLAPGFVFAALTGICIKESFCFGWWETALVAFCLPVLILGYLGGMLAPAVGTGLFAACALALLLVTIRKFFYPVPGDIGDKTIHAYVRGENHG
ncbi:DUF2301 domain-containing membrane protein [Gloeobacter kilaueensis]|uniref:Integral membrane protein n=1 Tax=Gloeobacter kilaueensis (strain ATCC BAA-2537 / CCAP 1431/1 / ULC 316 / JS1) TaxID=1183438 RepID=U5QC40_GLOK1|nr:DUF2301 domain-containing membrane protein [Gloeobacter kilaueensis]AGY56472.1 hypothetical protein GKIL_0225 [Gloeobacter kilaueensis JS1]